MTWHCSSRWPTANPLLSPFLSWALYSGHNSAGIPFRRHPRPAAGTAVVQRHRWPMAGSFGIWLSHHVPLFSHHLPRQLPGALPLPPVLRAVFILLSCPVIQSRCNHDPYSSVHCSVGYGWGRSDWTAVGRARRTSRALCRVQPCPSRSSGRPAPLLSYL